MPEQQHWSAVGRQWLLRSRQKTEELHTARLLMYDRRTSLGCGLIYVSKSECAGMQVLLIELQIIPEIEQPTHGAYPATKRALKQREAAKGVANEATVVLEAKQSCVARVLTQLPV